MFLGLFLAHLWVKNCRELLQSTYNRERFDQPLEASSWLKNFKAANKHFLSQVTGPPAVCCWTVFKWLLSSLPESRRLQKTDVAETPVPLHFHTLYSQGARDPKLSHPRETGHQGAAASHAVQADPCLPRGRSLGPSEARFQLHNSLQITV